MRESCEEGETRVFCVPRKKKDSHARVMKEGASSDCCVSASTCYKYA